MIKPPPPKRPLAIYLHWPYCLSKCSYCSFASRPRENFGFGATPSGGMPEETWLTEAAQIRRGAKKKAVHNPGPARIGRILRPDEAQWCRTIQQELDNCADWIEDKGWYIESIFFGGGTPSLLTPGTVGWLLDFIINLWPPSADMEVSLEANPAASNREDFAGLRAAGVNRLSLGIQALDDGDLRQLGRLHTVAEAMRALEYANAVFPRVSFDIISGRPGQTVAAWEQELKTVAALASGHVSVYSLTLEPDTPLAVAHAAGRLTMPDEDTVATQYELTEAMLGAAGHAAYEISNYAVPGEECRHNLMYWRSECYVGVGPGAHGRLDLIKEKIRYATTNFPDPALWADAVASVGLGGFYPELLGVTERMEELLLMGLRLAEGIPEERFVTLTGHPLEAWLPRSKRDPLIDAGLLTNEDTVLRATPAGRRCLDSLVLSLVRKITTQDDPGAQRQAHQGGRQGERWI